MAEEFEKGDEVECSSHGGTASGEVEERITRRAKAAGRPVSASEDDPQYLVKSEKSGGRPCTSRRPCSGRGDGEASPGENRGARVTRGYAIPAARRPSPA
jgi:hypothetical protein